MKNKLLTTLNALILSSFFAFLPAFGEIEISANESNQEIYFYDTVYNDSNLSGDSFVDKTYLKNYATKYFFGLTTNFGNNVAGTCAYVALGALLSYYDTYWDDTIIPEAYDKNDITGSNSFDLGSSPGVLYESGASYTSDGNPNNDSDADAYYNQMQTMYGETSFQAKLLKIAKEKNFYNSATPTTLNPDPPPGGLAPTEVYEILSYYLYDELDFTQNQVVIEMDTSSNMESFIVERVEAGTPVLLMATNDTGSKAHTMVAYDYTTQGGNRLFVHLGDKNDDGTYYHNNPLDEEYTRFKCAIALKFNTSHECSNNYVYIPSPSQGIQNTWCSCEYINHKVNDCSIKYENMSFAGINAEPQIVMGNYPSSAPTSYQKETGMNVSNITANYTTSAYIKMRFLGWYTDKTFTTQITQILPKTGPHTLYAKWRIDYNNPSRTTTYTISGSDEFDHSFDEIVLGLEDTTRFAELEALGFKYLAINFNLRLWEKNDGYQHVFIYGDNGDDKLLAELEFDYGGNDTVTSKGVETHTIYIPLSALQGSEYLYIRYSATGWWANTWYNDYLYLEMMFVVDQTDISSPDFYWASQNPF